MSPEMTPFKDRMAFFAVVFVYVRRSLNVQVTCGVTPEVSILFICSDIIL